MRVISFWTANLWLDVEHWRGFYGRVILVLFYGKFGHDMKTQHGADWKTSFI